jgi:hypothetical protein
MAGRNPDEPETDRDHPAPETHNAEQDDHLAQAQEVAEEALHASRAGPGPTESEKGGDSGLMDDSTQDVIDHMRDMESSGVIDNHAFDGEPNDDDEEDKYGDREGLDALPGGAS